MQDLVPCRGRIPVAARLCDIDFFAVISEITGQSRRYQEIYQSQVAPYGTADGDLKSICDLVASSDRLPPAEWEQVLFWLLVEPFAAIEKKERKEIP